MGARPRDGGAAVGGRRAHRIIGTGSIGGTLARLWTTAGHEIAVANSRGPGSLTDLVGSLGPLAHAMTVEDAAAFGEIVVLAVPFRRLEALPRPELVMGKVVVDAMNPYAEGGGLLDLGGRTSSSLTAERLPGARLVKAFNTMHPETLASGGRPHVPEEQRLAGARGRRRASQGARGDPDPRGRVRAGGHGVARDRRAAAGAGIEHLQPDDAPVRRSTHARHDVRFDRSDLRGGATQRSSVG